MSAKGSDTRATLASELQEGAGMNCAGARQKEEGRVRELARGSGLHFPHFPRIKFESLISKIRLTRFI